jgi:hypothetical protein
MCYSFQHASTEAEIERLYRTQRQVFSRTIRLVSTEFCTCDDFVGEQEHHLVFERKECTLIEYLMSDIHRWSAISYAWGEYDRRNHVLGHYLGDATKTVTFELGGE